MEDLNCGNRNMRRYFRNHINRILFLVTALILTLSQVCMAQAAQTDQEKKMKEQWVQTALARELLAGYDLLDHIPEDAPWLVRVNQGTCTVTVYRVLQVEKEKIPFYEGVDSIVKNAEEEAQEAAREREERSLDSAFDKTSKSGNTDENGSQEKTILRQFRKIVLRQLKRTDAPTDESGQTVTLALPVYACVCSVGANGATPNGTYTLYDHLRWHELVGPTWGQWCCHFAPSFLFHSLPYDRPNDPNSLQKDVYNLLGTAASHGCIRLAAVDAKYIYDHIPSGGKVEIFSGTAKDDPLGTPQRPFIGVWEGTYDPTDPEFRP